MHQKLTKLLLVFLTLTSLTTFSSVQAQAEIKLNFVGVATRTVDKEDVKRLDMTGEPTGALVVKLQDNSPANDLLFPDDIIMRYGGVFITSYEDFLVATQLTDVGKEVTLYVYRNNKFELVRFTPKIDIPPTTVAEAFMVAVSMNLQKTEMSACDAISIAGANAPLMPLLESAIKEHKIDCTKTDENIAGNQPKEIEETTPESTEEDIAEATDIDIYRASSGSGFAASSYGHVITNHHVISGCQEIFVHTDGLEIPVRVIAYDTQNDLALLKGEFNPETVFPITSKKPELLQDIYVAGYPFGLNVSSSVKVTKGIISSLTGIGNNFSEIQIDAALQSGNSGGPILDGNGNVVGVAVAKLDVKFALKNFGAIPENTNFGIKASVVESILDSEQVDYPNPFNESITKSELGRRIAKGTYYISCWMTLAQIEAMKTKKVMFSDLK